MSPEAEVERQVARWADELALLTERRGERVAIDASTLDRSDVTTGLGPPGLVSANGSCRLLRAADGWIAVNLPRESDLEAVPAWIGCEPDAESWAAVKAAVPSRLRSELLEQARLLGLPVAEVKDPPRNREGNHAKHGGGGPPLRERGPLHHSPAASGPPPRAGEELRVLDLTSMWAGPLCGSLLARMGAQVTKVESTRRPDAMALAWPAFDQRLNGLKARVAIDFADREALAWLRNAIARADILITSARPRAFTGLGIAPRETLAANPRLIWCAISGYGWSGDGADRVAFGDDAAAAGGLLRWIGDEPHFLGDALADPLTGIAAALAILRARDEGRGGLLDIAMAQVSAAVAAPILQKLSA